MRILLAQKVWDHESWAGTTSIHPAALVVLGLAASVVFLGRRWTAAAAFFALAAGVSQAQRIVIAGLDFDLLRVLILFGFARAIMRGEFAFIKWSAIDTLMVLLGVASILATVVRTDGAGLVNRLGFAFNCWGLYFLFRVWIRTSEDLARFLLRLMPVVLVIASAFTVERVTGRNLFSFLGGVPQTTAVRNGRLRCQGAFPHAILAGVFFASLIPLYVGLLARRRDRQTVLLAIGGCIWVTLLSSSSTPLSALIIGCIGWAMFSFRSHLRLVQVSLLATATALHFVMKKGVWHLLARIDLVGGSTGWHRYHLIDRAIANLDEWWLYGVVSTDHWGAGLYDVTNQYILEGTRGGIWATLALLGIVVMAFASCGSLLRRGARSRQSIWLYYGLGCAILVHCCVFISVSYFGAMIVAWYLPIAAVVSIKQSEAQGQSRPSSRDAKIMDRLPVAPA